MSLETLLEAARYVELQEAQRLQQNAALLQAREEEPASPPPPARISAAAAPAVTTNGGLSPRTAVFPADDGKDFQKRVLGTREVHNKLEKNRRAHLKECFELLKKQLPATPEEKKSSNLSILHSALRYIQTLRRKEREYEHEMERLAREKIAAQQKLANLKKDLSAQWDHIDFNTLLPEAVPTAVEEVRGVRDAISHTASTASAAADLSEGEEPLQRGGPLYSSTSSLSSAATPCSPTAEDIQSSRVTAAIQTPQQHHVQLPVSAHMVTAGPGLAAALVSPTIQLLASSGGIRVVPTADPQPLSLTVHHQQTAAHHHSGIGTDRLRESPTTASISLPTLHLTNKMVALPGGAELNLLPANGSRKHPPLAALTGGLTLPNGVLSHTGMTLTTKSIGHAPVSGITHVVAPLGSHHAGLTPLVTPVTVVSQGSQVAHILATPQQLGGKVMTTTPLLKPVGSVPLVNAQYLSTATLVKPVVVVSSPSQLPPHSTT